ncbi:50S ribosomal protein L5 [candidate division TM6 bacterium RIFCSPHIGHO2_12_FULL_32_22]|nr:MAG: 50S ribosomal protein L5 [candidate division TM6 bacterium RIFCSPHIGHO2_12_FULL_32_22]
MQRSRFEKLYKEEVRPALKKELNLKNVMQVPRIEKIVLNVGSKEAVKDGKILQTISDGIQKISGQRPVKTVAKKSIAAFKIREDLPIGVKVTLRGKNMYNFLDKLINVSLPKVRDFQGVSNKLDRRGNYNLGIKDWMIFPEIDFSTFDKACGMNITIHTSTNKDEYAYQLLKKLGMPFKK